MPHYTYDALYRLTSEVRSGSYSYSYSYDNVGNRFSKTDSTGTTSFAYNTRDLLLTPV